MTNIKKTITIFKKGSTNKNAKTVKISCLGDSITNGVGSNLDPDDALNEKGSFKQYYRYFEDEYDVNTVNCGENGSFVAKYDVKKGFQPNNSRAFIERYVNIPDDSDIITIMGGVNDCQATYFTPSEFGSPNDPKNTEINTFCGALRSLISGIRSKCPNALIIYLTPLKYSSKKDNQGANWEYNEHLPHYVDAIKTICKDLAVPVIDLFTPEELDFCHSQKDKLIYGDRLHFGCMGHKILGKFILDKIINEGLIKTSD